MDGIWGTACGYKVLDSALNDGYLRRRGTEYLVSRLSSYQSAHRCSRQMDKYVHKAYVMRKEAYSRRQGHAMGDLRVQIYPVSVPDGEDR